MKVKKELMSVFCGVVWMIVGILLLYRGLNFLTDAYHLAKVGEGGPLVTALGHLVGSYANSIALLIAVGLLLGYIKGRLVLSKSMNRLLNRVDGLDEKTPFFKAIGKVYGWGQLVLILCMIALGVSMRLLGVPEDIRGLVLVAVGSGLTRASLVAFRAREATHAL